MIDRNDTEISNHGFFNRWTCPCCLNDLAAKMPGEFLCPECEHWLELSCETLTTCVTRMIDKNEAFGESR